MNIELGDKVRDKITGVEGIVTGQCSYITGCDQVLVQPKKAGGDYVQPHWFDVDRCEVKKRAAIKIEDVSSAARPGPDLPAPTK